MSGVLAIQGTFGHDSNSSHPEPAGMDQTETC